MRRLTGDTGGLPFFPRDSDELERAYRSIARDLVNQYAVGYIVPRPDERGRFRQVSVRLVPPARGVARTRAGYTAIGSIEPGADGVWRTTAMRGANMMSVSVNRDGAIEDR